MSKTNTLNSHVGESSNRPANKMGWKEITKWMKGKSKSFIKKFYGKKRRQFLKNIDNDKI